MRPKENVIFPYYLALFNYFTKLYNNGDGYYVCYTIRYIWCIRIIDIDIIYIYLCVTPLDINFVVKNKAYDDDDKRQNM